MNSIQNLIKTICNQQNIEFKIVSKDWVIILKKDDKIRYISGYKFPLNDHAVGQICDDKYALYDALKSFNIDVTECHILFKNYSIDEVIDYAAKYNFNMVAKSNTSTCGNQMYHTLDKEALLIAADQLLKTNYSISICPYYDIVNEYRVVVLNGEAVIIYGKKKPTVIGDGKSTIYQLLCNLNSNYFKNIKPNQKLNTVLEKGEIYEYNWQFNLSKGATAFIIDDKILEKQIKEIAINVAK